MDFDKVIQREKRLFYEYFEEQLKLNLIIINVIFKMSLLGLEKSNYYY